MKKLASTLSTFMVYIFFVYVLSFVAKYILHIQLVQSNLEHVYWVNIICDLVFIISAIALNYKVLFKNTFDGDTVLSKILSFILKLIIIFLIFMVVKIGVAIVCSLISALFHLNPEANNQAMIEQIIKLHPIGMFVSVCVFAPFMEELIFRGSIRKVVTNDWLFVLISGLLFGLIHVLKFQYLIIILLLAAVFINLIVISKLTKKRKIISTIIVCIGTFIIILLSLQLVSGNLIDVIKNISMSETVNSLSYITMGLCLAYIYKRYNNIYLCMGIHTLNNLFGYVVVIFTMIAK